MCIVIFMSITSIGRRYVGGGDLKIANIIISLPVFPFVRGEVLPATFSPPHLLDFFPPSSVSRLLLPASLLSCLLRISLNTVLPSQPWLPRLLLPCSSNSAALFGCLSSAILSTCPAHCNLLVTSLSVKLLCSPISSLNSTNIRLSTGLYRY